MPLMILFKHYFAHNYHIMYSFRYYVGFRFAGSIPVPYEAFQKILCGNIGKPNHIGVE